MKKTARDVRKGDALVGLGKVTEVLFGRDGFVVIFFRKRGYTSDIMLPPDYTFEVSEPVVPKG